MVTAATTARLDPAAAAAEPILVVDDVAKHFDTPEGPLVAVDRMSFTVAPGEFLAVIGPSGCGKSTLFNMIGGLLEDYDGRIAVAGEKVRGPHAAIGMVFQEESTFPWRTVIENVAFPLEIAGKGKKQRQEQAKRFIKLGGLDGCDIRSPAERSGSMVFQEESTFPSRTVIENVAFPLEIAGKGKKQRQEQAKRVTTLVGPDGFENRS